MSYIDRQLIPWVDSLPDPRLVPQYRGDWEAVEYEKADIVRFNDSLWISNAMTSVTESPANSAKWQSFNGALVTQNITNLSNTQLRTDTKVVATNSPVAINLATAIVVYSVSSSVDGRVRLYKTMGDAVSDQPRAVTDTPAVPIIFDLTLKANAPWVLNPVALGYSSTATYYLRVEPVTGTQAASVDLTILAQDKEELLNV